MSFKYIDLFAGIGGFHAALSALGGECVYASEIDEAAASIYKQNWNLAPAGDITLAANDETMDVPAHDVLVGGFPCQPFSKSGRQQGMDETRGTLFWNIAKIIEARKPTLVLLENVRNIAGPRHLHEWEVIISTLRDLGYEVSSEPMIVSPHRIHPKFGGRPQVRERVFIAATRLPKEKKSNPYVLPPTIERLGYDWNPQNWSLVKDLPLSQNLTPQEKTSAKLGDAEMEWLEAWNEFVVIMKQKLGKKTLPGFPIWADCWVDIKKLKIPADTPDWKVNFLRKNAEFYTEHRKVLDPWLKRWNKLNDFPPSRRKFEWQAQDSKDLFSTVMHFRPSGIRAKKPTYVPALVAITQTSILGKERRRLLPREAARLQGFPDWFSFEGQSDAATYKQLGNAVNVSAVYHVLRSLVERDIGLLKNKKELVDSILSAPANPDVRLVDEFEALSDEHWDRKPIRQLALPTVLGN